MSKGNPNPGLIECVVVVARGPRLVTGKDTNGKAIRKNSTKGDRVMLTSTQLQAWKDKVQPAKVYEANLQALAVQREAEAEALKAEAKASQHITPTQVSNLTDEALKEKMQEYNVPAQESREAAEEALNQAIASLNG